MISSKLFNDFTLIIRNIINNSINPLVFDCKLKNSNHDEEYIIVDITNDILNDILDVNKIIFNRIVTLDLEDFVNEIEKTFTDENEIEHQFNIDFPRSRMLINGIEINDCNSMKNYLRCTFDKEKVNRILMLSTQGVLGKPVELMYNYLLTNNLHIGEKKFNSSRNPYTVYIDTHNGISFLIVKKRNGTENIKNQTLTNSVIALIFLDSSLVRLLERVFPLTKLALLPQKTYHLLVRRPCMSLAVAQK